jgi:chromosome partitioning protein
MVTFTVTNKKGGVGKTTIATNLVQALALCGNKVLAIDNDEQHNLTKCLGLHIQNYDISHLYDINLEIDYDEYAKSVICNTMIKDADCLPSSSRLAHVDITKTNKLANLLQCSAITDNYDYCIIDCSPGIKNKENEYAIEVADMFIIPVEMKQLSLDAAYEMVDILINRYNKSKNDIVIIPNKYKSINKQNIVLSTFHNMYAGNVTNTVIPYDENLDSVITDRKAFLLSSSRSKATLNIINLLIEIFGIKDAENKINAIRKKERLEKSIESLNQYRAKKVLEDNLIN